MKLRTGPARNLKLNEVLDWTAAVLNRVDRARFFAKFEESQAVQYFYEPFLEAFDPELRKQLGVWYTPHEIVQYMVARVDTVAPRRTWSCRRPCRPKRLYPGSLLRHRFIPRRGLAPNPRTPLKERGNDALTARDLKDAAKEASLRIRNLARSIRGARICSWDCCSTTGRSSLRQRNERAGVYLTNALTGWEPPKGPKQRC